MSNQTKIDELFVEINATFSKAMEGYGALQKHVAQNPLISSVVLNTKPLEDNLGRIKDGYVDLAKNIKDIPEEIKKGLTDVQGVAKVTGQTVSQVFRNMSAEMKDSNLFKGMIEAISEAEKRSIQSAMNISTSFKSVKQDWSQVTKDIMQVAVTQNKNPVIQPALENLQRQIEGNKDINKLINGPTSNFLGKEFKENINEVASYLDKVIMQVRLAHEVTNQPMEFKFNASTTKDATEALKTVETETVKTGEAVSRVSALYKAAFVAQDSLHSEQASANLKLIADLENKKPVSIQPPEIFTTENIRNTVDGITLIDTNLTDLMAHLKNLGLLTTEVTQSMASAIKKVGIDKIGIDWDAVDKRAEELKTETAKLESDARVRVDAARAQQRKNIETPSPESAPVVKPTFAPGEEERLNKMAAKLTDLKSDYQLIAVAAVQTARDTGQSFEEAAKSIGATDEEISTLVSQFIKLDKTIAAVKPIPPLGINEISAATLQTTSDIAKNQQVSKLLEMLSTAKTLGNIEIPDLGLKVISTDLVEVMGTLKNLGMVEEPIFNGMIEEIQKVDKNLHTIVTTYAEIEAAAKKVAEAGFNTIQPMRPPPRPRLPEPDIVDHPPVETTRVLKPLVNANEIKDLEGLKTTFAAVTTEADKVVTALGKTGMAQSQITELSMKESAANADVSRSLEDFGKNLDDISKFDAAIMALKNYESVVIEIDSAIKKVNTNPPIQPPPVASTITTTNIRTIEELQRAFANLTKDADNMVEAMVAGGVAFDDLTSVALKDVSANADAAQAIEEASNAAGDTQKFEKAIAVLRDYEKTLTDLKAAAKAAIPPAQPSPPPTKPPQEPVERIPYPAQPPPRPISTEPDRNIETMKKVLQSLVDEELRVSKAFQDSGMSFDEWSQRMSKAATTGKDASAAVKAAIDSAGDVTKVTVATNELKNYEKVLNEIKATAGAVGAMGPPKLPPIGTPPVATGGGGGGGGGGTGGGGGNNNQPPKPPQLPPEELAKLERYQSYLSAIDEKWRQIAEIIIKQSQIQQIPFNEKAMQFDPEMGKALIAQFETIDNAIKMAIEMTRQFGETLVKELGPEKAAIIGASLTKVFQNAALDGKIPTASNYATELKKLVNSGQIDFGDALKTMEAIRAASQEMGNALVQSEQALNQHAGAQGRMGAATGNTFTQVMQATRAFGGFGLALMGTIPEMQQFMSILFGLVFSFNELQFGLNIIAALFGVISYAAKKANDEFDKQTDLLVKEKRSYGEINEILKQYTQYEQATGGRLVSGYMTTIKAIFGQSVEDQINEAKAQMSGFDKQIADAQKQQETETKFLTDLETQRQSIIQKIVDTPWKVTFEDQEMLRALDDLKAKHQATFDSLAKDIERYRALQANQGLSPQVNEGLKSLVTILSAESAQFKQSEMDMARNAKSADDLYLQLLKLRGVKTELIGKPLAPEIMSAGGPANDIIKKANQDIVNANKMNLQVRLDADQLFREYGLAKRQFEEQQRQNQLVLAARLQMPENQFDDFKRTIADIQEQFNSDDFSINFHITNPEESLRLINDRIEEAGRKAGIDYARAQNEAIAGEDARKKFNQPDFVAKYPEYVTMYKAQSLQLAQSLANSGADAQKTKEAMDQLALSIFNAANASDKLSEAQKAVPAQNVLISSWTQFRDLAKNLNTQIERGQAEHNRAMQEADSNYMYQRSRQFEDFAHQQLRAQQDFNYQQTQAEQDFQRSRQRTIDDFYYNESKTRQDYNYNRAKSERDFQIQQAREAEDHQIEMMRLTQQFDLDERDAIAEGNVVQVLRLRRRYDMEAKAKEEDYQRNKKREEEDHARQLADAEELYKRQEALRKESLDRQLAYMDADFDYQQKKQEANFERQQKIAKEEFDRQQILQKQAFDREQQLNETHWQIQKAQMVQAMEDQLKILAENLGKMGILNAEQAKKLFTDWGTILGDAKLGQELFSSYKWGRDLITQDSASFVAWMIGQFQRMYDWINSLPPPKWVGPSDMADCPTGYHKDQNGNCVPGARQASGGMMVANRSTPVLMGEGGEEEIGIFIPKSQLNSLSVGTRAPLGNMRVGNTDSTNPIPNEDISRFINEHLFDIKVHIDGDQIRPELEESLLSTLAQAVKDAIPSDFQRAGVKR